MSTTSPYAVVILAAGQSSRFKSADPKVLHPLAGKSLLQRAMSAAAGLQPHHTVVVVRHEGEKVAAHAREINPNVVIAEQDDIKGTGRAVHCALEVLASATGQTAQGTIVVTAGDTPLVDTELLTSLMVDHAQAKQDVTILTTTVENPAGYGRIVRDEAGVRAIVEEKDATDEQKRITEINTSIYAFDATNLIARLPEIGSDNNQGEVYLTDVVGLTLQAGGRVGTSHCADPIRVEGINTRQHLAQLSRELNVRVLDHWMSQGVTILDPASTWIDDSVELARDVTLLPGTMLHGTTRVGEGSTIGPQTSLINVIVGENTSVVRTQATDSQLADNVIIGPFAHLRPGTVVHEGGKIGGFVETKNANVGAGSKIPHLSYVGDATIGEASNIGAGTIFVNYDGVNKAHSQVGNAVRIGSDNTLIAPVRIGDGAYTGAGTVVKEDVPAGSLAVRDAGQRVIQDWVLKRRSGTASAQAAQAALDSTESENE